MTIHLQLNVHNGGLMLDLFYVTSILNFYIYTPLFITLYTMH